MSEVRVRPTPGGWVGPPWGGVGCRGEGGTRPARSALRCVMGVALSPVVARFLVNDNHSVSITRRATTTTSATAADGSSGRLAGLALAVGACSGTMAPS